MRTSKIQKIDDFKKNRDKSDVYKNEMCYKKLK